MPRLRALLWPQRPRLTSPLHGWPTMLALLSCSLIACTSTPVPASHASLEVCVAAQGNPAGAVVPCLNGTALEWTHALTLERLKPVIMTTHVQLDYVSVAVDFRQDGVGNRAVPIALALHEHGFPATVALVTALHAKIKAVILDAAAAMFVPHAPCFARDMSALVGMFVCTCFSRLNQSGTGVTMDVEVDPSGAATVPPQSLHFAVLTSSAHTQRPRLTLPTMCAGRSAGASFSLAEFQRAESEVPGQSQCSPASLLQTLTVHPTSVPVDPEDIESVLAFLCGPRLGEGVETVPVLPLNFQRPAGRVFIWTATHASGGPEAWMQLWRTLVDSGYEVYVYATPLARYDPSVPSRGAPAQQYFAAYGTPHIVPDLEGMRAGDIFLSRSDFRTSDLGFCDEVQRFRALGVRVYFWMLGLEEQFQHYRHLGCASSWSHSELTRLGKWSPYTLLHPYIKDRGGLGTHCPAVRRGVFPSAGAALAPRPHLIAFDGDVVDERLLGSFHEALAPLVPPGNGTSLTTIGGMTPDDVFSLLSRSRVVVDLAVAGLERLPLEAVLCGSLIVLDDSLEGSTQADFPIPPALVFTGMKFNRAAAVIAAASICFEDMQPLMAPLFHKTLQFEANLPGEVQRLFATDLHFVVWAGAGQEQCTLALLTALSVLAVLPMATVEVQMPDPSFLASRDSLSQLLISHQLVWSLVLLSTHTQDGGGSRVYPPHPVATGRLLATLTPGDVFVGEDFGRSADVGAFMAGSAAGVAASAAGGAGEGREFHIVDYATPGCVASQGRVGVGCQPLLRDDADTLGVRVDARSLVASGVAKSSCGAGGGLGPGVCARLRFLCRQPLWAHYVGEADAHPAFGALCALT